MSEQMAGVEEGGMMSERVGGFTKCDTCGGAVPFGSGGLCTPCFEKASKALKPLVLKKRPGQTEGYMKLILGEEEHPND